MPIRRHLGSIASSGKAQVQFVPFIALQWLAHSVDEGGQTVEHKRSKPDILFFNTADNTFSVDDLSN